MPTTRLGVLLCFSLVGTPNARAAVPTPAAAPKTPHRSVDAILADNVTALGGKKALSRHKSVRVKSEVTVKGMGLKGTEERHATASGKLLSVMTVPGIGSFRQGSTGKVRWSEDPINGLRVLSGAEDEQARIESTWNAELHTKTLFKKIRVVPPPAEAASTGDQAQTAHAQKPDGQTPDAQKPDAQTPTLECLELTPAVGAVQIVCFDARTHLRALQKGTHATPQGEVPFLARFSDWRDVGGGVKAPFKQEATAGPLGVEAQVISVELGVKIPGSLFDIPKPKPQP